jgi:Na+-driven multidrug efflux pump
MLIYFLLFTLAGYFIGKFFTQDKSVILIVVLAILWGMSSAPVWGLASLGEMLLGLYLSKIVNK